MTQHNSVSPLCKNKYCTSGKSSAQLCDDAQLVQPKPGTLRLFQDGEEETDSKVQHVRRGV